MRLHADAGRAADAAPRPRDAAATRADLLRAAKSRFTLYGYDRTTTRDIAAAAGVNVSLIARYFGSKDGLYAAVLEASAGTIDAHGFGDLVEEILAGLRRDAWPEFGGEHPLLLLLRHDTTDERTTELRRRALLGTVDRLTRELSGPAAAGPEARLRGATMLALIAGVAALHTAIPDPFAAADEDTLRTVLRDVVAALATGP